ncbi:2-dehydro-3-deoxy-6-phosphogalactonate aldolase [Aestuariivirga litoralis]|uniref:2-dehydro-3-deoxy-6-phosphogalactonate aldolase n=1 Tax=Aestuariivirga litoralis TaxID=2650924 RepID=A0A2W2BF71_9HYPH|nr:2-dehydro-3-deoxy-6-phosphogalactonate aldolase [Aestuariivirga litoralis]PZF78884.1 2-dehydro-3-deoxy-6-phosphogalactonate aldolase [Aestuariivirga litoralis]
MISFEEAAEHCGIVAIIRGVTLDEVAGVGDALYEAGIRIVEVPINSPEPFRSIAALAARFQGRMVVGAGTVLDIDSVDRVKSAGGQISVSPDCNPQVIARAVERGMVPLPGVFTPTEAFTAVRAGARHLKLFPAEAASPKTVKAWKAVLPRDVKVYAVGGVTPANMKDWADAGCAGFGIGSNIYKPGLSPQDVGRAARDFVAAWKDLRGN